MNTAIRTLLLSIIASVAMVGTASAHCQVPCGIYGDEDRFTAMLEDVTTLAKCVNKIEELSSVEASPLVNNQLVRWVQTKEQHADRIADVVLKYFLQQRIKPSQEHYKDKLVALHEIVLAAMKVKQTVDPSEVNKLEQAIKTFEGLYIHKH